MMLDSVDASSNY